MKTTGSVQEKNGRFYFVVNLYDANGKRKIKWISTGLTVRGNKRKAESMLREVLLHYDETGELPTGRGGAYEKVDAKTAKPLPQHLQPVSKSEMLFLDYLNEWVQVHKASIQPATFISYNRMITGRITQYFEPEQMIPAAAQGTLALELREDHKELFEQVNALSDIVTEEITCAERLFLKGTGGDCHMPIGAYACKLPDGRMQLLGMVGSADGSSIKKCKVFGETPQEAAQRALRETGCTR